MDLPALRTALTRLGFSNQAATYITDVQQLDNLEEFRILTDSEVEDLCKTIRKPGGTIANPVAGGPDIPNPGIPVPLQACNNLKLMCYFLRFKKRTSRTITAATITIPTVRSLLAYREWEKEHEDPLAPELTFKNWSRTIETLIDYLSQCLGTTKIPLAYVIRDEPVVSPEATDPETNYTTVQEQLIARAPHHNVNVPPVPIVYEQEYRDDNAAVFDKLAALTRDKDCWTYVQKAAKSRDGRKAFLALKDHYLGKNNVDNQATIAEGKLRDTTYNGEQRRWNFERYVRVHVDQHAILEGLTEYGYAGIDPRSKVRYLLDGVKTNEYQHVKVQIMADSNLRSNFEGCVNLFQDFIKQQKPQREANISAVTITRPGKRSSEWDDTKPDMTVEDRYYTGEEYTNMSLAQKKGLDIKRSKRGHKRGRKDSKNPHSPKPKQQALNKRDIKAVKRLVEKEKQKDKKKEAEVVDSDSDDSDDANTKNNRTNKALIRKKHN